MKRLFSSLMLAGLTTLPASGFAADSYRWLHVTIETPWIIFLILLPMVLIPAVLMAILYWKFAGSTPEVEKKDESSKQPSESLTSKSEPTDL